MAYEVDNLEVVIKSQAKDAVSSLSSLNDQVQKLSGNVFKIAGAYLGIKTLHNSLVNAAAKNLEFTRSMNLFTVSMGKYYEQGIKFQNQMNQALGTNMADTLKNQGQFMAMAKSMGVANQQAYDLSENMTKLAYDLSALYGLSTSDAMTKLTSGIIGGQSEPLRKVGIDITEGSIRPISESLGIKENIRDMSQAEKILLRYIATLRQSQIAHGEFARTIEAPANQVRVMQQQLAELGRVIANVFMGTLGRILPYINGFIMALKEIFIWLGMLVGYDATTGMTNLKNATGGVSSDLGDANTQAKKLKTNLQGFDEINLYDADTSGGGGSGGGAGGGIDSRLLDAMSSYDNLMGSVRMKATDIRDRIMEWLGFTKYVNEEIGEVTWKLNDGYTNLKKIRDIAIAIGAIFIAWKIAKFVLEIIKIVEGFSKIYKWLLVIDKAKFFTMVNKLVGIALVIWGIIEAVKTLKELLSNDTDFLKVFEGIIKTMAIIGVGIALLTTAFIGGIAAIIIGIGFAIATIIIKWDAFCAGLKYLWELFINAIREKVEAFRIGWSAIWDYIGNYFSNKVEAFRIGWNYMVDKIKEKWQGFKTWILDIIYSIGTTFSNSWDNIRTGFTNLWNSLKTTASNIGTSIGNAVSGAIKGVINAVITRVETTVNNFIGGIRSIIDLVSNFGIKIPKPNYIWLPRMYATGGFPEDGLFFANSSELVGRFDNGKTAVANNAQITAGIEEASYRGFMRALSSQGDTGSGNNSPIDLVINGRDIARVTIEDFNREALRLGYQPILRRV